ncbi:SEC-C motif-containing protein [Burkholderia sp. WP9]|uniref:SEC-C metal-binding domain-containing protein n=1 Tax=Burkholderia sp. WP9 TaxID=1500263 RepID=UPI00089B4492|nr:SEC-C metal-binding domain-containing protein [Burkholderia sp. WP9]SEF11652.1 SEC-C motif-containing protein [Burkholderia sp. WP9]
MEARYFQLLAQLADFGEDLCRSRIAPDTWHEYLQSGFDQSHLPDLIRILDDDTLHESEFTGIAMAPIHAWRILAELKAVEAIPALISLIHRIDDDWIGEEFPDVFSKIGPSSLEAVELYARDSRNGEFARICTFRLIARMGCDHPEQRTRCVEILTDLLRAHGTNDPDINGFLVWALSDLGALESFAVVREAYEKNHVALSILGDLRDAEDYFMIVSKDYEDIKIVREARLNRLRTLSEAHPFEPTPIIGKSRPIVAGHKVGRNDLCLCGSGKKDKECHGVTATLHQGHST